MNSTWMSQWNDVEGRTQTDVMALIKELAEGFENE